MRVYQQAARDLKEMEEHQVIELRRRDHELAKTYEKARNELMRTLERWEESKDS